MKKKYLISLLSVFILAFSIVNVSALEKTNIAIQKEVETYVNNMFYDLEDHDKVLALPNGGYLHGHAKLVNGLNTDIVYKEYDSETDSNAITVREAKKSIQYDIINMNSVVIQPRGANVPNLESSTIILYDQGTYRSQTFSASGWRFGGYFFLSEASTGDYLKWSTYNDSGVVGTHGYASQTKKTGVAYGKAIYPGTPQYISYGRNPQIYYTFNPTNNPYYIVENK